MAYDLKRARAFMLLSQIAALNKYADYAASVGFGAEAKRVCDIVIAGAEPELLNIAFDKGLRPHLLFRQSAQAPFSCSMRESSAGVGKYSTRSCSGAGPDRSVTRTAFDGSENSRLIRVVVLDAEASPDSARAIISLMHVMTSPMRDVSLTIERLVMDVGFGAVSAPPTALITAPSIQSRGER